ncbi:ribose-phosphate pyrophosphokinase [Patescibacteria group bacterium]|nr:ribose-phosphate pyrophosphokinase [Patescibacteria group bacterium]
MTSDFAVFSLGSNDPLAQKIASKMGVKLGQIKLKTFSDGEQYVQFEENIRGKSVFLIQSTNPPAENWTRLFIALDAARGASAREVTAVIPYFGYARQERKSKPREAISARAFAMLLDTMGADHVLAMDLHTDSIGGFFRKANMDYLYARPVFINFFKDFFKNELAENKLVVVSPDVGGAARAQSYAKRMMESADLAIIHKERELPNQVAKVRLVGDVKGKVALIIDDMLDTCGTLAKASELLKASGATAVYAAVTHGVLSGPANERLDAAPIDKVFITDTISPERKLSSKIQVISVGDIFGDAIKRIVSDESLSALFEAE